MVATLGGVRDAVGALLGAGRWPLLLAGDCTATIGACAALRDQFGGIGLVYVDGHIDLYDGRTSPTGESADFPLAVLCGLGPPELRAAAHEADPLVEPRRIALLGPRDHDEAAGLGSPLPEDRVLGGALARPRRIAAHGVGVEVEHLGIDVLGQRRAETGGLVVVAGAEQRDPSRLDQRVASCAAARSSGGPRPQSTASGKSADSPVGEVRPS